MSQALQQPKGDDTRAELSHGNEATFLVYQFHLPCQCICLFFYFRIFFCKAASNVGPYGLFWQPALVCHSVILYYICLCLLGK